MTVAPVHAATAKTGPLSVAYVEVNNNDLANVGDYQLASNGANVFDIAVIFAANINYTNGAAQLSLNPQVQATLNSGEVAALQAKGIKVYLSILGNHQGAGVSNFPDQASAQAFAQQLVNAETQYGLDGIDYDDEYADYGTNGTGQPNAWSFPYLVDAVHTLAPTKGQSLYFYGPDTNSLSYGTINVGNILNYSYNSQYGTWSVPNVPGMTKAQLSPAAIDIQSTSSSTASSLASQTLSNGYGVYMTYNLPNGDDAGYVSSFAQTLYGSQAIYTPTGTATLTGPSAAITSSGGKCVTSSSGGNQLTVATCNGGAGQSWFFSSDGTLHSQGECMDVRQSGTTSGTVVQLWGCNGTSAQQWTYNATTKTYTDFSGLCLDAVKTSAVGIGSTLATVVNTCNGGTSQQWSHP